MKYLKLIRFGNLLMLALMQLLFRYGFLNSQNIPLALNDWQYFLLVFATVMIAAGGYVINNIMDQDTDNYNKPQKVIVGKSISEASAYNIYFIVTVLGVGTGFYLSNVIAKPGYATVFILISATLYLYATSLKQMFLIGNLIVAFLLSFSVLIIGIFDLLPVINPENKIVMRDMFSVLLDYSLFAFVINFIREIVKDMEDIKGDYKQGMSTLPIILGLKNTSKVILVLSLVPLIMITFYIKNYFLPNDLHLATLYALTTIVSPLLFFTIKIDSAKKKKDFSRLSTILKLIILFGLLSIVVVTYNITHHA